MRQYVTHFFAHEQTLDRAQRWLIQTGFMPEEIETHREGVPWIAVRADSGLRAAARLVFSAAEHADPSGWPSFWEVARMSHAPAVGEKSGQIDSPAASRRAPIGWHPLNDKAFGAGLGRTSDDDPFETVTRFA